MEEYCEKHGGLGVNQFELDGCPGCLWEGIKEELETSRKANINLLKSLSRAEIGLIEAREIIRECEPKILLGPDSLKVWVRSFLETG